MTRFFIMLVLICCLAGTSQAESRNIRDFKVRTCQSIPEVMTKGYMAEGLSLARATFELLKSENPGQRQYAYRMLNEVLDQINLHCADCFETYKYVYCGPDMHKVHVNLVGDYLTESSFMAIYRPMIMRVVILLEVKEFASFFLTELQQEDDAWRSVQLLYSYIKLQEIRSTEDLEQLGIRIPALSRRPRLKRAFQLYRQALDEHKCLCPPSSRKENERVFFEPFNECL